MSAYSIYLDKFDHDDFVWQANLLQIPPNIIQLQIAAWWTHKSRASYYDIITRLFIAFISYLIKKFANSNQFVEIYLAIKQKSKEEIHKIVSHQMYAHWI